MVDNFKEMNLKPGNPNGTWTQNVKMLGVTSNLRAQFVTDEERWVMDIGIDIIGNTYQKKSKVYLQKVDLVFVDMVYQRLSTDGMTIKIST